MRFWSGDELHYTAEFPFGGDTIGDASIVLRPAKTPTWLGTILIEMACGCGQSCSTDYTEQHLRIWCQSCGTNIFIYRPAQK